MRHRKAGVHLSRTAAHRKALFSNLVTALIENEQIKTTHVKARETRRIAERTITIARRVGDILKKKPDKRSSEEQARVVHAMRQAGQVVRGRGNVAKLFDDIAPRFAGRRGGYTRIIKLGQRPGDAAPISLLSLVEDAAPAGKAEKSGGDKAAKASGKSDKGSKAEANPAEGRKASAKSSSKAPSRAKAKVEASE